MKKGSQILSSQDNKEFLDHSRDRESKDRIVSVYLTKGLQEIKIDSKMGKEISGE